MTDEDVRPAWGADEEMNPFESLMWRMGSADPALRAATLSCEVLDRVPDWGRFVAAHEWAVRMAPRFRQRVVEPALGLGTARWAEDPQFDLRFHLRRQRLPEGAGWPELLETVGQFYMTPLDRTRAPWEIVLYEGLPDGQALYTLKMHHSVTDGMGVMQLLSRLHSHTREPNPDKPQPEFDAGDDLDPIGALLRQFKGDVNSVPGMIWHAGGDALHALTNPVGSAVSAVKYVRSLGRVLNPQVGTPSPLLARRSMTMGLGAIDVPFADFKAAAKSAGGSVNDGFLAAITGGFRRYHEAMGTPPAEAMPTSLPVSVRKPDDPEGGNQIVTVRLAGPLAERDPAKRIARFRELVGAVREEPAAAVVELAAPAIARLPAPVIAQVAGPMTKGNDVMASCVPGLTGDYYLAGAKVERFFGYGPLSGGATLITFVTSGTTACVGVGYDTASVTEPKLFMDAMLEGFAEVLALREGAAEPILRG
jgi:diacylglycerol O-acyltransferase / wax synthase